MEYEFAKLLTEKGLSEHSVQVLEDDSVFSVAIHCNNIYLYFFIFQRKQYPYTKPALVVDVSFLHPLRIPPVKCLMEEPYVVVVL